MKHLLILFLALIFMSGCIPVQDSTVKLFESHNLAILGGEETIQLVLLDEEVPHRYNVLVWDVISYNVVKDKLFIHGAYELTNQRSELRYFDINSNQVRERGVAEEVPEYMIFDSLSGEYEFYGNREDVPNEEQKEFLQESSFIKCDLLRKCYKK